MAAWHFRGLWLLKQDPNPQQRQLSGPTPFSRRGGVFYPRMCLHLTLFLAFPRPPRTVPDNNKTSPATLWSWCHHPPPGLQLKGLGRNACLQGLCSRDWQTLSGQVRDPKLLPSVGMRPVPTRPQAGKAAPDWTQGSAREGGKERGEVQREGEGREGR